LPEDVSFLVAGSAADTAEVERLRSYPRTKYLGPLPAESIAAMIQHANVVVMPNVIVPDKQDVEGFGLVAVETATVGGLLVASRLQGIADAVIDGVSGKLVEPGNAPAWVAAIHDTLALAPKEQEQLRAAARQATLNSFSRKRMLRDVLAILDSRMLDTI
jgi:phosphatidylinositol alpha-1,6-mannosyltransferase